MADSLILSGVNSVSKHKGKELRLARPKRGGDVHSIKEWWNLGGSKQYTNCTIFDVTVLQTTVKLALTTSGVSNIRIDHDGAFGFNFYGNSGVARAALFTENMELIEHYVFPAISGGKIMTVIPPNAAEKPVASEPKELIGVSISGPTAAEVSDEFTYEASIDGTADDISYSWVVDAAATIVGSATKSTVTVSFEEESAETVIGVTVTSTDPTLNGPNTRRSSLSVEVVSTTDDETSS